MCEELRPSSEVRELEGQAAARIPGGKKPEIRPSIVNLLKLACSRASVAFYSIFLPGSSPWDGVADGGSGYPSIRLT